MRQVERLVKKINEPREPSEKPLQDPNIKAAVRELESALGTRVRIVEKTDQRGRIEIEYYSQEDLQRVYEMISRHSQGMNGAGGRTRTCDLRIMRPPL